MPDHKAWLVVQGVNPDEFYIDHTHPFGAAWASSNLGMIANALVDIWIASGVFPILKYEDDFNIFCISCPDGPFVDGDFCYDYDWDAMMCYINCLRAPWHPLKGDRFFSSVTTFISLLWDLSKRTVSLPEHKCVKFLSHVQSFFSNFSGHQCLLRDVEKIHGSLCYISFVYPLGRSHLPLLSNFTTTFKGNEYVRRYPPPSVLTDLHWWATTLSEIGVVHNLIPRGPTVDLGIFVDASTSWGIGVVIRAKWASFELAPSWKIPGRDICWLETLAVEFTVYLVDAMGISNSRILLHLDNQGTIGAVAKGHSPNFHINYSICRTYTMLSSIFVTPELLYVASADNPADPLLRGECGLPGSRLDQKFMLPYELQPIFKPNDSFLPF